MCVCTHCCTGQVLFVFLYPNVKTTSIELFYLDSYISLATLSSGIYPRSYFGLFTVSIGLHYNGQVVFEKIIY